MSAQAQIKALQKSVDNIVDLLDEMLSSGRKPPKDLIDEIADSLKATNNKIAELELRPEPFEREEEETSSVPPSGPPPLGSDLLWILSGGKPDAFVNYLRTYPDPALNALAQNPQHLASVIQGLQKSLPQGVTEYADGIKHADLNSSNIYGFKYEPKSGKLFVRFQGGSVYGYDGVPSGVFDIFRKGAVPAKTNGSNQYGAWYTGKMPSLGAAFYQMIRQGGYAYKRIK